MNQKHLVLTDVSEARRRQGLSPHAGKYIQTHQKKEKKEEHNKGKEEKRRRQREEHVKEQHQEAVEVAAEAVADAKAEAQTSEWQQSPKRVKAIRGSKAVSSSAHGTNSAGENTIYFSSSSSFSSHSHLFRKISFSSFVFPLVIYLIPSISFPLTKNMNTYIERHNNKDI